MRIGGAPVNLYCNCKCRQRINTEEKAKVVTVSRGRNCFNSLPHMQFYTKRNWRKASIEKWPHGGLDALKKWMIIRFTFHQTTTLQNECSPQTNSSNHPCCWMVNAAFNCVPQAATTTFAFSSVFILLLWCWRTVNHKMFGSVLVIQQL